VGPVELGSTAGVRMPVDATAAKNQFLATMATVIQRGGARDPAAIETVAKSAAQDVAAEHPGVASDELLAALPDVWTKDPSSSNAGSTTNAFLQVAGPVLGVPQERVSPIAARMMQLGKETTVEAALRRADRADLDAAPAFHVAVDLTTATIPALRAAIDQVFLEPDFLWKNALVRDRNGAPRDIVDGLIGALHMMRPAAADGPTVMAGGVEVAGPNVTQAYRDRPHGLFRALPSTTTALALAQVVAELAALRGAMDEERMRGALSGGSARYLAGRNPSPETMPVHAGVLEDGRIGIGFGIDVAPLRKFHDEPGVDDMELALRAGKALRALDADLTNHLDHGVPVGLWSDARGARTSDAVKKRLAGAPAVTPAAE
jgi:hypothetical protein